jgi:large-conductance mechanosensitive channel
VRAINRLVRRAKEEEKPAELSKTELLLTEIRDLLKSR